MQREMPLCRVGSDEKAVNCLYFFFSSRRRHTRCSRDWSSDVCSSDLGSAVGGTLNGGVIPSAGGAELSYFPAGALSRSDAALQFGARLLWTNAASGLAIDQRSLQAGPRGGCQARWPNQPIHRTAPGATNG